MKLGIGAINPCNLATPKDHFVVREMLQCGGTSSRRVVSNVQLKVKSSWNPKGTEPNDSAACRAEIRHKWKEYQGIKNWEGLLDPLDDDLRSEILRYGDFVDAAYRSFEFDTSEEEYATCKYPKQSLMARCGLGSSGYKLTKNLNATCGAEVPGWMEKGPSWMSKNSSWVGYVAVCDDKDEIARLGRRDVVIAYRGTATFLEWVENMRTSLAELNDDVASQSGKPMVQSGFLSMYTARTATCPSLREMVRSEMSRIFKKYGDEPLSVTITGHSLGAALATLTAYDINTSFDQSPLVTVVSFGGPRVGNKPFRDQLEQSGTRILRIVNSTDLITKVPGFLVDDTSVRSMRDAQMAKLPSWLQKHVEDTQWLYTDVGKELRLSSDDSPYLKKRNMVTCHDLKTYLHLVDGFVSSTCPFRKTARRLLDAAHIENQQVLVR